LQQKKTAAAVKTIIDARTRFPGLPVLSYSLGVALTQAKQPEKAIEAFEETSQEAGNSSDTVLDSRFYFNYGIAAEQAGLLEKAAELLRKSIELDPDNAATAYNYLGYMWTDRGVHLDEALDLIKHALALDPNNGAYLDSLGWCYYKMANYGQALISLQKAVQHLKPEDTVVYEHLGDIYAAMNNTPQAIAAWKKALALDPTNKAAAEKLDETLKTGRLPALPSPSPSPSPAPAPAASPS
jgi:tetratricopeptide (TPR) repeat protein